MRAHFPPPALARARVPVTPPAPAFTLALAFVLASAQGACFDRVVSLAPPRDGATRPRFAAPSVPIAPPPPHGVDAHLWEWTPELSRTSFLVLWDTTVFARECGDGSPTSESWWALTLLVDRHEVRLLQRLAQHAPQAEARALALIGLVKLRAISRDEARALLAALNERVDTCSGCIVIHEDEPAENLMDYFDAPLADVPGFRHWYPPSFGPPLELPGTPRVRVLTAPSSQPPADSPPLDL